MFKRVFFAMLGLGAGVFIGVQVVRKAQRTQAKLSPSALGSAATEKVEATGSRWRAALTEGRRVAAEREAQLRAVYRGGQPDQPPGPAGSSPPSRGV